MSFDFGISATQSGINNWINNEFQRYANQAERGFEREMSDIEWNRAKEAWEMTNTYNSPVEQRRRLQEAGLNPALMYGKGASPGIAGPAPGYNPPISGHFGEGMGFEVQTNGLNGVLNAYNDLRQTTAEVDLKSAQTEYWKNKGTIEGYLKDLFSWQPEDSDVAYSGGVKMKPGLYSIMADMNTNKLKQSQSETERKHAEALIKQMEANFAQRRWEIWDRQGIDIDQMTNIGKIVEQKYGGFAGALLDAMLNKVKSR